MKLLRLVVTWVCASVAVLCFAAAGLVLIPVAGGPDTADAVAAATFAVLGLTSLAIPLLLALVSRNRPGRGRARSHRP